MRLHNKMMLSALLAIATMLNGCAATPIKKSDHWVATWGTSQVVPTPNTAGFNQQTVRLITHTTLGGDQVRIRVANTFGVRPLSIGAASIALQSSGAAIVTTSSRAITFGGRAAAIIPPGAVLVSDPLNVSVLAQQNLAISLYFPADTGLPSAHPGATQVSYVSTTGNFVAQVDATPFVTEIQSWPYLTSVEVSTDSAARSIVAFGDSITDGYKSTVNANHRWPDYFVARLQQAGRSIAVVNQGISGNRILHDAAAARPIFGPNALSRFDRDALVISGASHVIVLIGINDIGMGSITRSPDEAVSADDIIIGLQQLALRAHAQGLTIIGATLTPFSQAAYYTEQGEQQRQAVNQWLRTSKVFDAVIDFDQAVRDPAKPSQMLPTYDSGDHLHPSDAGYEAMAKVIDLKLFD